MTCQIAFVGPLPPPIHGFSTVCADVLKLLAANSTVEVFDRTPRGNNLIMRRLRQLFQPLRYMRSRVKTRPVSLYLALSGGYGQLFDWPFIVISKGFGARIFIHHHSFAYLNSPSLFNRVFFSLLRKNTHIVLSNGMGSALSNTYKLDSNCVKVVSNAAFFAPASAEIRGETPSDAPLCLGFLSNITFEKGFVEFFDVLSQLKARGIPYQAKVAGPISPDALERFSELLASASHTDYLGPVSGDAKQRFYAQLDCFLFPTDYANEAEPLVILEALRSGVPVIACDRGAIAEMLANGAGRVLSKASFVPGAVEWIERFSRDRAQLRMAQQQSRDQFQRIQGAAKSAWESVLQEMTGIVSV